MSIIHFVWYGPYSEYEYVKTVDDVALACPDHEVWFWCEKPAVPIFRQNLHPKITIKPCNLVRDVVGEKIYNGANKKWFEDAQANVVQLDYHMAFSAIKDLMSLLILYTYGGYYFDTTTFLPKNIRNNELNNALKKTFKDPRFVQLPVGAAKHSIGLQSGKAIEEGVDFAEAAKPFFIQLEISIDVWTIYAPRQHRALELMFMSYISRCNKAGLYPGGKSHSIDFVDGNIVLNDTAGGKGSKRNKLIGRLITHAVYDGMLVECCKYNPKKLGSFCWPSEFTGESNVLTLPELGIRKRYHGSWRLV